MFNTLNNSSTKWNPYGTPQTFICLVKLFLVFHINQKHFSGILLETGNTKVFFETRIATNLVSFASSSSTFLFSFDIIVVVNLIMINRNFFWGNFSCRAAKIKSSKLICIQWTNQWSFKFCEIPRKLVLGTSWKFMICRGNLHTTLHKKITCLTSPDCHVSCDAYFEKRAA